VTQICVFALQLLKTDDANLRFNTRLVFTHLITQYMDFFLLVLWVGFLKKMWLYFELMIYKNDIEEKIPVCKVLKLLLLWIVT
jgi:hypothetical protein